MVVAMSKRDPALGPGSSVPDGAAGRDQHRRGEFDRLEFPDSTIQLLIEAPEAMGPGAPNMVAPAPITEHRS
jgi:hypothetical protein